MIFLGIYNLEPGWDQRNNDKETGHPPDPLDGEVVAEVTAAPVELEAGHQEVKVCGVLAQGQTQETQNKD